MTKRKTANTHPMIAAVLAELPAKGAAAFGLAERASWLRLMASTFDVVYGPCAPIAIGGGVVAESVPAAAGAVRAAAAAASQVVRFYIDRENYARRDPGGIRVVPEHVSDVIFDDRGEHGDLGSIIWADGRTGVLGLQLEISAVPDKAKVG